MNCSIEARLLGVSWCNLNLPEVSFFCLERGQIMLTELGLWGTDMVSAYSIVGNRVVQNQQERDLMEELGLLKEQTQPRAD